MAASSDCPCCSSIRRLSRTGVRSRIRRHSSSGSTRFWSSSRGRPRLDAVRAHRPGPERPRRSRPASRCATMRPGAAGEPVMQEEDRSPEELKRRLTPEQYHVTQEGGTERPFTGEYYALKAPGEYLCVVCRQQLFSSETKYDSGTGWPSFYEPVRQEALSTHEDRSLGRVREEVRCP